MKVYTRYIELFVNDNDRKVIWPSIEKARDGIVNGTCEGSEFLGWHDWPENYNRDEYKRIKAAAARIQKNSDILVVIGTGGSDLGARAVINFLGNDNPNSPDILFTGHNLDSIELSGIIEKLDGKNWSINVISKSGTTLEPAIAFDVLREKLVEQYGEEEANRRIYATTDAKTGTLHNTAVSKGYEMFTVPDDIAGRFSVLTPVGLLPIAVAGIDIDGLMRGAREGRNQFMTNFKDYAATSYAVDRSILRDNGFNVEIMAYFESCFGQMAEWCVQLSDETGGKSKKSILTLSIPFTEKLHSLGQYIQAGGLQKQLFEVFVTIEKTSEKEEVFIPGSNDLGLNCLKNMPLSNINKEACESTAMAHNEGGRPVILINIAERTSYEVGYFIQSMFYAIAMSSLLDKINPFDQPGVENYKKELHKRLSFNQKN